MSRGGIPILYEDNHLLVVVKPRGMPVQADSSGNPDLLTVLKADLKVRHAKPGNVFLGLVHRLDQPVGGVMVLAKTSKGAARLSEQIRARTFRKVYLADVEGVPEPRAARLEHWLVKDGRMNRVHIVSPDTAGAKRAVLEYRVEEVGEGMSRVRIELETGRPHQIRVQMAAIGCPIVGDTKYGGPPSAVLGLWAWELGFLHPTKREPLTFRAEAEGGTEEHSK